MSLQFNPNLGGRELRDRENQQRNHDMLQAIALIGQGIGGYQDSKRQNALMEFQKQQNANQQTEFGWKQAEQNRLNMPQGQQPGWNQPGQGDLTMQPTFGQSSGPSSPNPLSLFQGGRPGSQNMSPETEAGSGRGVLDHWDQQMPHLASGRQPVNYPGIPQELNDAYNNPNMTPRQVSEQQSRFGTGLAYEKTQSEINKNNMPKTPGGATTGALSWETATPTQQHMAKAMVEGNLLPSDLGMRDRATVVGLANEYALNNNLPFQSYGGNVKKGMAENLAYGKMGQNALSLNTALGHAGDALKSYEAIGNMDVNLLNQPINAIKRSTNDPKIIALGLNLNALHGELANVFKGSGGTDQEIGSWMQYLNENLTPLQAREAIVKVNELLRSRLGALEYQQSNVMDQPVTQRKLLSPHGAELSNKFSNMESINPQQSIGPRWDPAKEQRYQQWKASHP